MSTAPIPLTIDPDHGQLERIRPMLHDRRCVVVGSAPLRTRTAQIDPDDYVICVNGAISSLAGVPDLWLLNSKPSRTALHVTMLRQARGRQAGHVVFLRGTQAPTEYDSLVHLEHLGCRVGSWSVLDKPIKRWLEEEICARPQGLKTACSAGVFAVALALWCGASRVRMVGFAWRAGYHYLPGQTPARGHVEPDRRALLALTVRYPSKLEGALVPV